MGLAGVTWGGLGQLCGEVVAAGHFVAGFKPSHLCDLPISEQQSSSGL
jgi:hypothetical protein